MHKNLVMNNLENKGLTTQEVAERIREGKVNTGSDTGTKSIRQIILNNTFTFFNLVNFVLAALIIYVGSYKNLLFMGVVFSNTIIGIFQEIKAKRTIDKLSLLAKQGVKVIRDGLEKNIPDEELVVDDIIALTGGEQIPADAVLLDGNLEVNESLLTGESEPVIKKEMDTLLSGSFVISGNAIAKVEKVGPESYAGKLSSQVKVTNDKSSEIQSSLDSLIKAIAVSLVPLGIIFFLKEYFILNSGMTESVLGTSAALISLIPSGLVLLTSMVFVLSVIKLSRYNTLVQERSSVETLARVDMLCLDKTGTITEGTISLDQIVPVGSSKLPEIENDLILLTQALDDDNPTMQAVRNNFKDTKNSSSFRILKTIPFSSARKYSGASFEINGKTESLIMGAGSFVLGDQYKEYQSLIDQHANASNRILVLCSSDQPITGLELPNNLKLIAILIFSDIIRSDAKQTLDYFEEQGVKLKIISGDDPRTASAIASKAGLDNAEQYVDATTFKTDQDIKDNIEKYNVFGRVTPQQKKKFIEALKEKGHTVAMTGDGVNDVLALKEADTSIAMASGSGAARSVADLVLIDSNFSSLPKIVAEGRQQINNLQKSAALYINKTVYSLILIVVYIFLTVSYPFSPIQLTLVNTVCIGLPSFILALEPNRARIKGRFLTNVLYHSIPSGIMTAAGILFVNLVGYLIGYDEVLVSTLSVYALTFAGFILIIRLCRPFNLLRILLVAILLIGYIGADLLFGSFFMVTAVPLIGWIVLMITLVLEVILFEYLSSPKIAPTISQKTEALFNKISEVLRVNKKS